ncbi:Helicase SEN1 [Cyphellophora attinorum]|uniref:Helicase SEN1 n=1 Tax=Cyphellophora attinorum TaxID=1664694 RepID=A0A0N1HJZ6_9EURO|nr:Helicase SEN1 [Phialophora attinorum]KPI36972.1 Helicase SEN1 [Phialophora attinorum]
MSELIPPLLELQRLGPNIHLLCPRQDEDDQDRYEEDIQGAELSETQDTARRKRIQDARQRREKFISCLQLLAYDGNESEKYQRMIWDTLDETLGKCDICIRNYYVEKLRFLSKLREEYEEPDVQQFFGLIDRRDISRIKKGLDAAEEVLRAQPEQKRGVAVLEPAQLHALFEALLCEAFLKDEDAVAKHFDEPFRLIQTKKPLKIREILPSTVRFLFSSKTLRLNWATSTWARLDRSPSKLEWTWSIQDQLQQRLQQSVDAASIARFWSGMMVIVRTLSEDMITHQLFDLQPKICTAALDHLHKPTSAVPFITQSLATILTKAPKAFWQMLGPISTQTIAEQIFGSPRFTKALNETTADENSTLSVLQWAVPLLSSLEIGNRPAACEALSTQLFDKLHVLEVSEDGKKACFETAVKVMLKTVVSFSAETDDKAPPSRIVVQTVLKTIGDHLPDLLDPRKVGITSELSKNAQRGVLDIVRNSIALECQLLRWEFRSLYDKKTLPSEPTGFAKSVWNAIITALRSDNTALSQDFLLGLSALGALEQFRVRGNDISSTLAKQKLAFNTAYKDVCNAVCKALETIADFDPEHLDTLYKKQDTSMQLIASLFSSDEGIQQAATSLIKNISGEPSRRDALTHILDAFFAPTIWSLCWALRRISHMRTFSPVPQMVSACMDIIEVLCDSSSGKLRTRRSVDAKEKQSVQSLWSYMWLALRTIFQKMEDWSNEVHDKPLMTEVCRDTMQMAQALFEEYQVFASFLKKRESDKEDSDFSKHLLASTGNGGRDLGSPVSTIAVMAKWLRLRDQYLAETLVKLLTNMLSRLKSQAVNIDIDGLDYISNVATTNVVRTILTDREKATLIRALENYTGKQMSKPVGKVQTKLEMRQWAAAKDSGSVSASSSRRQSGDDFGDDDILDVDFAQLTKNYAGLQKDKKLPSSQFASAVNKSSILAKKAESYAVQKAAQKDKERSAFLLERKKTEEQRKLRDKQNAAKMKGKVLGEGMGLLGKEHAAPTESSMMVSSESESDSDEDIGRVQKLPNNVPYTQSTKAVPQGPTKIKKRVQSQKDIRSRLAPDLTGLHKTILAWDFFADTDLPPNSTKTDYTLVTNTFKDVQDYQKTFEPLLILEGWQAFRAAREDGTFKPFEIKIANSLLIDSFFEVNVSMPMQQGNDLGLGPTDVVLLSKSDRPTSDPDQPHCLARIKEIKRQKGEFQIVFRINAAGNPLRPHLNDKATIWAAQILSLTTLEREYGALTALPYYDLVQEAITATPSPLLNYSSEEVQPLIRTYDVNEAQAKAVKSAVDNDGFTLVQGPPGSGKTKTICAIVGALMTGHVSSKSRSGPQLNTQQSAPRAEKRLMVCAPSNAAVDELVMRLKQGLKLADGTTTKINVVRLGRSDAINSNVMDVTLEELVKAKLNVGPKEEKEDIHKYMMDHKKVSTEIIELRNSIDAKRQRGETVSDQDNNAYDGLKRKKTQLGSKIDQLKDKANQESRSADLNRRRVQQEVLDSAHVLCATLSGSGHDLFQSLNVEFETVIIDEAAQSIELSALIPLKYGCSKCILVGDPKQLPPTVLSREAARFQYEQSLFARMEKNHKKNIHLLDTQYRMHPEISLFPSRTFYDSRLKDGAGMAKLRARPWHHSSILAPYRFFDIQGMSESSTKGHSLINIAEINIAMALYDRLTTDVRKYNFRGKIGVITPYKGQLRELKSRFRIRYGEDITSAVEFNTTDAFQGRESEIIIFSCVRASTKGIGFLNDIRRMNVGLTRAKCSLWVLGNSGALNQGEFWRGLISDAKSRKLYTDGDDDVDMADVHSDSRSESSAQSRESSVGVATPVVAKPPARPADNLSRKSSSSSILSVNRPETVRKESLKTALSHVEPPIEHQRTTSPITNIDRSRPCGEVGHKFTACTVPRKLWLTSDQQAEVIKQEERFKAKREKDLAKWRAKQLGEHAGVIPEVKSSYVEGAPTEPKRKRDEGASAIAGSGKVKVPRTDGPADDGQTGVSANSNGIRVPYNGTSSGGNGMAKKVLAQPPPVVKKKKTNADAMFMKRK